MLAACSDLYDPCLAVGYEDGSVILWTWHENERQLLEMAALDHDTSVSGLSWASGGELLAVASGSRIVVWCHDGTSWCEHVVLEAGENISDIYDIDLSESLCAAGGTGGTAAVWHLHRHWRSSDLGADEGLPSRARLTPGAVAIFQHAADVRVAINCVCLSTDSRHFATGGADCRLSLWCLNSSEMLMTFYHRLPSSTCNLCTACVNAMRFAPDCATLVAGGYDGVVTVWKLPQAVPIVGP